MGGERLRVFTLAMTLGLALASSAPRAQSLGSDAAAKAKLVTTLARFVQWPPNAFEAEGTALRLCVLSGSAAVDRAFLGYQGTLVGTRLTAVTINPAVSLRVCHVLYLDDSTPPSAAKLVRAHASEPLFTVGALDGFVGEGGMVEIVQVDNTLRFDIDLVALRAAGLHVHPGVLKLARQVRQTP